VPDLGQRAFLAQVGDAYYGWVTLDTGNDRVDLQGPEAFTVCYQLFRGEILATENKDVVFEEGRVYLREGLVVQAREIDASNFRSQRSGETPRVYRD
jgi:hypothetical protein